MLLESGNVSNNEIIKAIDLNNSFVAQIENIGKVFKTTFGIDKDFVIGKQNLIEFSSMAESDWGLIINPVFGLCNKTNTMFLNTENTTASIQAPIDGESRVDTIEVQGKLEGDGLDKRAFIDFNTMSKTVMPVDTKLVLKLKFNVVKGIPGSIAAPQHTDGWVKIGEIVVPGNATKISDCTIRNITSDVIGEINADWTNEKDCTYNLSSVTEINKHFRETHEISGEHKENSINIKHIKTGIESDDVNSTVIPSGKQFTINEEVVGNTESLASVIEKIVSVLNNTVTGKQNLITITDDSNAITDETAFIEMDAGQNPSSGKRHLFSKIWTWIVSHTQSVLTTNDTDPVNSVAVLEGLSKKQDNLVSGSNIKTIHSKSLVGEGDVTLSYSDVGALAENGKAVSAGSADSAAEANHALSADIASAVARAKFGDNTNETHDCNEALNNGFYYYTANGPSTDIGASTTDGGLYVQRYSDDWLCQIAQDYRNGTLFVRGKNNGSWTAWQKIGAADNAKKLETWKADGSGTYGAQYPLYAKWIDSILKLVCDGYTVKVDAADSATNATSAGISTSVVDYGDGATPIKIGYAGAGLETATYLAGYYVDEAGNRFIKDISPSKVTVGGAGNSDTLDGRHDWGFNMVRQSSNVGAYSSSLDDLADGYFSTGMTNGGGPFGGLWTHFINLGWNVGGADWNSQIAICPQDTTKPMMFRPYSATADWHTLIDDKNIGQFAGNMNLKGYYNVEKNEPFLFYKLPELYSFVNNDSYESFTIANDNYVVIYGFRIGKAKVYDKQLNFIKIINFHSEYNKQVLLDDDNNLIYGPHVYNISSDDSYTLDIDNSLNVVGIVEKYYIFYHNQSSRSYISEGLPKNMSDIIEIDVTPYAFINNLYFGRNIYGQYFYGSSVFSIENSIDYSILAYIKGYYYGFYKNYSDNNLYKSANLIDWTLVNHPNISKNDKFAFKYGYLINGSVQTNRINLNYFDGDRVVQQNIASSITDSTLKIQFTKNKIILSLDDKEGYQGYYFESDFSDELTLIKKGDVYVAINSNDTIKDKDILICMEDNTEPIVIPTGDHSA